MCLQKLTKLNSWPEWC